MIYIFICIAIISVSFTVSYNLYLKDKRMKLEEVLSKVDTYHTRINDLTNSFDKIDKDLRVLTDKTNKLEFRSK